MRGKMYYLGVLCLVASTVALPTIPSSLSSNEINENKELYKNNVEVHKASFLTGESYTENTDTEDWIEEQEIDENIIDPKQDSKEVEDEEVGNEDKEAEEAEAEEAEAEEAEAEEAEAEEAEAEEAEAEEAEDEKVEDEDVEDEEVEDEEVEVEAVDDEKDRNKDKYANFEKSVIIKWKIPTYFLLNRLITNMSPELRTPYPYGYRPFRFPYVQYPGFIKY